MAKSKLEKLGLADVFSGSLANSPTIYTGQTSSIILPDSEDDWKTMELGLEDAIKDVTSSGVIVPKDLKIDDGDMKEFPNFYEFCFSAHGVNETPFIRQLQFATFLFAEYCPRCSHKKFRPDNMEFLDVGYKAKDLPEYVQLLHHGVCPKCGATKYDLFTSGELRVYQELAGCGGQRSGKSALLGLMVPYLVQKWLKLQRPVEALGLMKNSILMGTFVGLTFSKAIELLWIPIHNVLQTSPWFVEYHEMLGYYANKYGTEDLFKFKDTFVQYGHRNLYLAPSGPNKRTLRGATRVITAIDEIGWFSHGEDNDTKERASANEVYVALDRSLKTVRMSAMNALRNGNNNIPQAYAMNISSPSSFMDKISTLVRTHEGSDEVFTYHFATWQLNPMFKKIDFAKEYREDPVKAERDFGAMPPMSTNPWISDIFHIRDQMKDSRRNCVSYEYKKGRGRGKRGKPFRYAKLTRTRGTASGKAHILTIDAGFSNNSFSIALGYVKTRGERLLPVISGLIEIAPKKHKLVLNFTKISKHILYKLIEAYNVKLVVADRWNSLKILSDIEEEFMIPTVQYSMGPDDFSLLHDYLTDEDDRSITLPRPNLKFGKIETTELNNYPHNFKYDPASHMYHQFMTVAEDQRGTVQKGAGYTDDVLRATTLALVFLLNEDMIEEYELLDVKKSVARAVGAKSGTAATTVTSDVGAKGTSNGVGGQKVFSSV